MEKKTYRGRMELKEGGEPGEFVCAFATLNVKDEDGDVTLPDAFTDGEKVRIAHWGHGWDELPVGRGEIRGEEDEALCEGQFFLDTQGGKEHYQTVKNLGELQEWSYGFDILESEKGKFEGEDVQFLKKMKVIEVSPVMLGAGVNTHTVDIKALKGALEGEGKEEALQELHDLLVSLGAKCSEPSDGEGEDGNEDEARKGKSSEGRPGTLAARVAMELLEININEV